MKKSISGQTAILTIAVVIILIGLFYMWRAGPDQDAKHKEELIMGSAMGGKPLPAALPKGNMPE